MGKWGKICRNAWDFNDFKVICRQHGFEDALAEFIGSDVKEDEIPFVMFDVACSGSEPQLASCPRTDENLNRDVNPLTPTSDQYRISPYNINTISSRQVMRIKKIIS